MDSKTPDDGIFLTGVPAFNSIEWIPSSTGSCTNAVCVEAFNSIEWIRDFAVRVADVFALSIPLNGFAGTSIRRSPCGVVSHFQFHWMDSCTFVSDGPPPWHPYIFQFHWMDSSRRTRRTWARCSMRLFQFHWMDSCYNKLVEVFLHSRATFQFHWMDSCFPHLRRTQHPHLSIPLNGFTSKRMRDLPIYQ